MSISVALMLLLGGIRFRFYADFYLIEIFAVLNLIFKTNSMKSSFFFPRLRYMYHLITIWIAMILLSCILNGSELKAYFIALGSPFILLALILFFSQLCSRYEISKVLYLTPYNLGLVNGWKYQYGTSVGILCIFLAEVRRSALKLRLVLIFLALISLNYESRSLAAFFISGLLIDLFSKRNSNQIARLSVRTKGIVAFSPIGVFLAYLYLAQQKLLGDHEFLRSSLLIGSPWRLLAGRSEIFYTFPAFLKSPFYGYGGNLNINQNFIDGINNWLIENNVLLQDQVYRTSGLPVHSYIFSSLLYGGVFAGLFWVYLTYRLFQVVIKEEYADSRFISTSRFLAINLIWNILFSPWGASQRVIVALTVLFIFGKKAIHDSVDPVSN
jgi:hypothetical protein